MTRVEGKTKEAAKPYIDILRKKTVGEPGRRIYPDEVLDHILDRDDYLPTGLRLQQNVDGYVAEIGSVFGIGGEPGEIIATVSDITLKNLSDRVKAKKEQGVKVVMFHPFVGPGGAGKDAVLDNVKEETDGEISIGRPKKYYTRDKTRAGGGAYYFLDDLDEMYGVTGDMPLTDEETQKIRDAANIQVEGNTLSLEEMRALEKYVNDTDGVSEWNFQIDIDDSDYLEFMYRQGKGWTATSKSEVTSALESNDVSVLTGKPQNLAQMMKWLRGERDDVDTLMMYVFPPHPAQFTSAARALGRDGLEQPTEQLLAGTRQTEEIGIFVELLKEGKLDRDDVVIILNDRLLEDPEVTGNLRTDAGKKVADALLGKFDI